ncbi:30S ribosomal protein S16, partial [Francisella tularensis]|uniref:30S ribosomal protein S16 n=1 Tax=Francisella tularensis TaxID=263 RepID=UPI002381A2EE
RGGAKKRSFYRIVVADKRSPRDGRIIEKLGFFNPLAKGGEERLKLDVAKSEAWLAKGEQPSDRVASLIKEAKKAA